ncbi:GGDEF domain-containing protein [Parasalinivibrio latis]|uniref:GGDEF domain-containing protein n=1 Tax=Parasalinivibrio latis TaxID=2952610 RepID=UPI0030E4B10A
MNSSHQTLLEQMRITEFEISTRKQLLNLTHDDEMLLGSCKEKIENNLKSLIDKFYSEQTSMPEVALLIGDRDTLSKLKITQEKYIRDLFSGYYDMEYVNHRLRIGLVHKRIGVEPKLYLAAIHALQNHIVSLFKEMIPNTEEREPILRALEKLILFDITLVFDCYIKSMLTEIEIAKNKSEQYASLLEEKISERTAQLEELSRTDALTGLLNVRHLEESVTRMLRAAERRREPVLIAFIDIDDFKIINDSHGHQYGDEVICAVAESIKAASRIEDECFRYGGDEFCVLMSNCSMNAVTIWQDRVLKFLSENIQHVNLSFGFSQAGPESYPSAKEALINADKDMYRTKSTKKRSNGVVSISKKNAAKSNH